MNALIQNLILSLIVAWSAWSLLRRYFPKPIHRLKERLAAKAEQIGMMKLGHTLRKVPAASADCSSGCSSCHGCDSSNDSPDDSISIEKPVTLRSSSHH
jgi:hypothetical protein